MIFMGVGQHQTNEILPLFFEKANVRHDEIDARQVLLIAKGHAEVDGEPGALMAIAEPVDRKVHADLADAAKRREGQFVGTRHYAAPAEAAAPKWTSPAALGMPLPSDVATIREPESSMVSKVPDMVDAPDWIDTGWPSPPPRPPHLPRISPNPPPLSRAPPFSRPEAQR